METPWGEVRISDAHVHFFSHRFFQLLGRQKGDLTAEDVTRAVGWQPPPLDPADLGRVWIEELDRQGVATAVMIASVPGDEDSVAAAVGRYPERVHGFFLVNPLAADAEERLGRALNCGLRGVCFFPAMQCYSMHDERAIRLLELTAARPGTVAFVHCGALTVGIRKKLGLPSRFDMRFSNPIDVHAIALRFPALPFIIPHFGAGYLREALMVADMCPNVYLDTSSSNSWVRYQPAPMTLRDVFERAFAVLGPHRLLFGTDSSFFPRGWNREILDRQVRILQEIGTSVEHAAAILGGTLRRLLQSP